MLSSVSYPRRLYRDNALAWAAAGFKDTELGV